jgi:hypothetical protein
MSQSLVRPPQGSTLACGKTHPLPTLSNGDHIARLKTNKARRAMCSQIGVAFLVTIVLFNVVKILTTNDDRSFHFRRNDSTCQDASTNGNVAGKRALPVNVMSLNGLLWCLESKAYLLVPAFPCATLGKHAFAILEDRFLPLKRTLNLFEERRNHGFFRAPNHRHVTCSMRLPFTMSSEGWPGKKSASIDRDSLHR